MTRKQLEKLAKDNGRTIVVDEASTWTYGAKGYDVAIKGLDGMWYEPTRNHGVKLSVLKTELLHKGIIKDS
jgi:hypothetical protein